ncbi:HEPN domain-containing protein [Streptomyces cyaneofuscatus]
MPRQKFITQLADVYELLDLADALTIRHPSLTYFPHRISVNPLLAGAVVLLCARFEEFIKSAVTYAFEQHAKAVPPLQLQDLSEDVQVRIVHQSLNAALQPTRYGVRRPNSDRLQDSFDIAKRFLAGNIWADHAIDTGGNPGPETVKNLLKLVGVTDAWAALQAECNKNYVPPSITGLNLMQVGHPKDRLAEIIKVRNSVAHSGAHITSSSAEIRYDVDFVGQLSGWIYDILQKHVEDFALSKGRTPAVWRPR